MNYPLDDSVFMDTQVAANFVHIFVHPNEVGVTRFSYANSNEIYM